MDVAAAPLGLTPYRPGFTVFFMDAAATMTPGTMAPARSRLELSLLLVAAGFFFLPYMNLRPQSLLFTFSDLLFLLSGAAFLLRGHLSIAPFGSWTPVWLISVVFMIGGLFVSSVVHDATDRWLSVGAQYAFSLLILPMVFAVSTWARWTTLARALVLGVIGMEILTFSILNYYGWDYTAISSRYGYDFYSGAGRVSGFIGGANLHAAVLCMTIPFVYYLRLQGKLPLPLFLAAIAAIGVGVFYSASVTGFASMILVSVIFAVLSRVRISPKFVAGAAAAAAVFVLSGAPLPKAFDKRVGSALESGQIEDAGTYAGRLELIKEAWELANDSMIIGIGADNYRKESQYKIPVHNIYMLLWVEGGLVAVIGWVGLIGVLGFAGITMLNRRPLDAALALSVLAVLVIYSIAAPHMYARVWFAPVLLAVAPVFARLRSDG
jgi:O-antigen ligase